MTERATAGHRNDDWRCSGRVVLEVEDEEVVVVRVVSLGAAGEFEGRDGLHEVGGELDVGVVEEKVLGEAADAVAGDLDGVLHGLDGDDATESDAKGAFAGKVEVLGGDGHGADAAVDDFVAFDRGAARLADADGNAPGYANAGAGGAANDFALDALFGVADVGEYIEQVLALEEFERQGLVVGPVHLGKLAVVEDGNDVVAALEFESQGVLFGFAPALPDDVFSLPLPFAGLALFVLAFLVVGQGFADPADGWHAAGLF